MQNAKLKISSPFLLLTSYLLTFPRFQIVKAEESGNWKLRAVSCFTPYFKRLFIDLIMLNLHCLHYYLDLIAVALDHDIFCLSPSVCFMIAMVISSIEEKLYCTQL